MYVSSRKPPGKFCRNVRRHRSGPLVFVRGGYGRYARQETLRHELLRVARGPAEHGEDPLGRRALTGPGGPTDFREIDRPGHGGDGMSVTQDGVDRALITGLAVFALLLFGSNVTATSSNSSDHAAKKNERRGAKSSTST